MYCPEGTLELPIDIWHCKLTGTACPIQAEIDPGDWASFHSHCLASSERQAGIQQAIETGKYDGFHHMPGKWLCPTCKPARSGNPNRQYHFEWELLPLRPFVPYEEHRLRIELLKRHIPMTALSGHLCRDCLDDILRRLDLATTKDYFDQPGYGEPMNEGEPVSFHIYRSIREQATGAPVFEGTCGWCGEPFSWNETGDCICIDVHTVTIASGKTNEFRLCGRCGQQLAELFGVED